MNSKRTLFLEKHFPKNSIICEVGVHTGNNAKRILQNCEPKILYLIDPWSSRSHQDYVSISASDKSEIERLNRHYEDNYQKCLETIKDFNEDRYKIIRNMGDVASEMFSDGFFDVVYIDALHNYKSIFADLHLWYPKVKGGGILSGHDYCKTSNCGVYSAVNDFCKEKGLEVNYFGEGPCDGDDSPSDFIIKV
ncbi:MAG: class I SAM-dependent methyltransferase [Proteobacteria bacterium]|nr:class I SAM-dependent methyltransferase [Pseudomonadota bacterium]